MPETVTVATIGNPNVGKSVIFNNLVPGARQHVGNWPGKTVEKKEGWFTHKGVEIKLVDLPGTYSLTARAVDELIARSYITEENPDVVLDIIDASNLERNLYLTTLLLELEANLVVALNMTDLAKEKGYSIDADELSDQLGVPVVPTVATEKKGMTELKDTILEAAQTSNIREQRTEKNKKKEKRVQGKPKRTYGEGVEDYIATLVGVIQEGEALQEYPSRWVAVKILEGDQEALRRIRDTKIEEEILEIREEAEASLGDPEILLADQRYSYISRVLEESLVRGERRWTTSDMLDKVFLDKFLGIPVFLAFMWMLFQFATETSAVYMAIIEGFFGWLGGVAQQIPHPLAASLVADGIIGGLGGVLVFIPPIFFTFLGIAILEDSGYLSRAAFVMDRLMYKLGLHGRSFIPMLLGFGCNVPAIMACRSIEGEKDRLITILVNPLMSCGARLPVYVLVAGAFYGAGSGSLVWSMYLLGIVLAIAVAYTLRKTILKGEPAPFILELPTYKPPTIRSSLFHMWERGVVFLKKAGTYLFGAALLLWFLTTFPLGAPVKETYAGLIGRLVEPLLRPLGFDWRIGTALIFGLLAKEVVVGALGIIYRAQGETALRAAIASSLTPVQGIAFMAFVLIYIPCVATIATIKAETGSWKWPIFSLVYQTALAYLVSYLIVALGGAL
ncbi:MAG: ferrous iron transport protein B [Candidatus Bathyarchaeia archaeon]